MVRNLVEREKPMNKYDAALLLAAIFISAFGIGIGLTTDEVRTGRSVNQHFMAQVMDDPQWIKGDRLDAR